MRVFLLSLVGGDLMEHPVRVFRSYEAAERDAKTDLEDGAYVITPLEMDETHE